MGATELEGFTHADPDRDHHIVIYDPMPGGSGFLPQIVAFWELAPGTRGRWWCIWGRWGGRWGKQSCSQP